MRYHYLLTGLTFMWLLAPSDAAWAGAAAINDGEREEDFVHVCRGGTNNGGSCTVSLDTGERKEEGCPQGKCEIDFLTPVIEGTLFLIVDEDVTVPSFSSCNPPDPGCIPCERLCQLKDLMNTALTVLLRVEKDGRTHFFAEAHASSEDWVDFEEFDGANEGSIPDKSDLTSVRREFIFLAPESDLARGLRALFLATQIRERSIIPVIVEIKGISKFDHQEGKAQPNLASISQLRIGFRFVKRAQ